MACKLNVSSADTFFDGIVSSELRYVHQKATLQCPATEVLKSECKYSRLAGQPYHSSLIPTDKAWKPEGQPTLTLTIHPSPPRRTCLTPALWNAK